MKAYCTQSRAGRAGGSSEPERFIAAGEKILGLVHARAVAIGGGHAPRRHLHIPQRPSCPYTCIHRTGRKRRICSAGSRALAGIPIPIALYLGLGSSISNRAVEVFGDENKARSWMDTPRDIFGGRSPQDLVATGEAAAQRRVLEVLLRIDYGVLLIFRNANLPNAPFGAGSGRLYGCSKPMGTH